MGIEIGCKGYATTKVHPGNTAKAVGSGSVDVFATPMMVALMEEAAINALQLEPGQASVGISLDVKHTAATPVGMEVRAEAELIEIDRRRLVFKVAAYDEVEQIGSGIHERFIIDLDAFMSKAQNKLNKTGK